MNKSRMSFFLKLAKQEPIYMYHGTGVRNLPSILSGGLVSNPRRKVWEEDESSSFSFPSRASVGGIYFTKNLMTAISSSGNSNRSGKEDKIIIIARVMPGSLYADEDAVDLAPVRFPDAVPNERLSCYLYLYWKYGDRMNDWDKEGMRVDWDRCVDLYVESSLKKLRWVFGDEEVDSRLLERVKQILREGFVTALKRQVEHVDDRVLRSAGETLLGREVEVEGVSSGQGEEEYRKYMDRLTRTLRVVALREIERGSGLQSGRVEGAVGYRGGNRIVGVVRLKRIQDGGYGIEVVWSGEEGIPEEAKVDFRKQFTNNVDSESQFPPEMM